MGIQKIRSLGPRSDTRGVQAKHIVSENGCFHEKFLENASFNDNDDCEVEEAGCECIKVGAQTCSVPYELYDLTDLKMILSLENWNSCLSEDERFSLAAFLPDMDQETFCLTIKELLNGDVMFFESPLEQFFCFLKGGLFCPRVTHLRECLQFLQRTEHYYFIRQYYETMRQKFLEMRIVWNKCQPNISAEERLHMWRNKKNQKPVLLVDLNAYPDEDLLNKVDRNAEAISSFQGHKYSSNTYESAAHFGGPVWNTKTTAKGVLKIKPVEMKPMHSQFIQPLANNFGETCRRMPKGVLKIKPKYEHGNLLKPKLHPEHISTDLIDNCAPKVIQSKFSSRPNIHNFGVKPAFLPMVGDRNRSTYRYPDLAQDQPRKESGIAGFNSFEDSESFHRKINMMTDLKLQKAAEIRQEIAPLKSNQKLRIFSEDKNLTVDYHKEPDLRQESRSHRSRLVHASSADSDVEPLQSVPENTLDKRTRDIIPEKEQKISSIDIDRNEADKPSDHLYYEECYQSDSELEGPAFAASVSDVGKGTVLPITYKRKKPYRKVDQVDSLGQQPAMMNLDPDIPSQGLKNKPKSIKIKLKGWTGYNAL